MPNRAFPSEGKDPAGGEQILSAAELELVTLRAQRAPVQSTRTIVRLLGLLLLLGLLAAGLGAMLYLQTVVLPPRPSRPEPALTGRAP